MPINSRAKGARSERLWASKCAEEGYPMRRSQQYCGVAGDSDCIPTGNHALSAFHHEVKAVEKLNLMDAMTQAVADASKTGKTPIVAHKRNSGRWHVTMLADDWFTLVRNAFAEKDIVALVRSAEAA
jgi:hypothetical protein